MTSIGEQWPIERARVEVLMGEYREIGPAGQFALLMIGDVIKRADEAWSSQDVVAIVRSFKEMKECQ